MFSVRIISRDGFNLAPVRRARKAENVTVSCRIPSEEAFVSDRQRFLKTQAPKNFYDQIRRASRQPDMRKIRMKQKENGHPRVIANDHFTIRTSGMDSRNLSSRALDRGANERGRRHAFADKAFTR